MSTDASFPPSLRFVGASLWALEGSFMQEMLGARAWFRKVHESTGVRMAFLCTGSWLVQWYEGAPEAATRAWAMAQEHGAHRNLRLLHRSRGPLYLPQPVHIASLHDGAKPTDVARRLHALEREHTLGWRTEPIDIWKALSAPTTLRGVDAADAVARRNVVALTSEYNECVDVLKALADRCNAITVYQRFAGAELRSPDVGAAYVDLPATGYVTRIHALSRAALAQPMARQGVRDAQRLVLVVGSRPHAAQALAEQVANCLCDEAIAPRITVLGPDAASCAAAAQVLERAGCAHPIDVVCANVPNSGRVDVVLDLLAADVPNPAAPQPAG
jgi:hypothetical protein